MIEEGIVFEHNMLVIYNNKTLAHHIESLGLPMVSCLTSSGGLIIYINNAIDVTSIEDEINE